ncbi:Xanthine-guanine phosphoribosyltransferase [hydrothermal vent metagenome]|uniref:Xanthine-guanine phosphoribosyltransferase n=1 Tax=hydrothermal vent metagenome TaxID=652676 RepID=A0A1W1B912_9ZZZZ
MRHYYDYEEFLQDCHSLTQQIDWEFDTIIGIARGGLTLSHLLGEYYNIREVYAINTIGYNDTKKLDHTEVFNIPDIKSAKNILLVDDIVDSGETLELVLKTLSTRYPHARLKTASLLYKETACIKPDWYVKHADVWIDFFWSDDLKKISSDKPLHSEL